MNIILSVTYVEELKLRSMSLGKVRIELVVVTRCPFMLRSFPGYVLGIAFFVWVKVQWSVEKSEVQICDRSEIVRR